MVDNLGDVEAGEQTKEYSMFPRIDAGHTKAGRKGECI